SLGCCSRLVWRTVRKTIPIHGPGQQFIDIHVNDPHYRCRHSHWHRRISSHQKEKKKPSIPQVISTCIDERKKREIGRASCRERVGSSRVEGEVDMRSDTTCV